MAVAVTSPRPKARAQNIALLIRHRDRDIAFGCIGSTMAFGGVEDRSQTMCASGHPPRLDPKTLPFYVPPRSFQASLFGAAAGQAGATDAERTAARLGEVHDCRAAAGFNRQQVRHDRWPGSVRLHGREFNGSNLPLGITACSASVALRSMTSSDRSCIIQHSRQTPKTLAVVGLLMAGVVSSSAPTYFLTGISVPQVTHSWCGGAERPSHQ